MKTPLKVKKKFENEIWVVGRHEGSFFIGRTCKIEQSETVSLITANGVSKVVPFDSIREIKKISFENKLSRPIIVSTLFTKKKLSATEKLIIQTLKDINKS